MITYIKNAFVNNIYNLRGSPASVELVENIDDISYMLYQTKKLKLPISVFLKKTNIGNKFQVRYFIEDGEEPICGHGTIVATQFLLDTKLVNQKHIKNIEYIPMFSSDKYGNNKQNSIFAKINKDSSISIFISTKKTKIIVEEKKQEIIKSISEKNSEYFNILNIIEGEFDYTVEIEKSEFSKNKKILSLEIIKKIIPNFDLIENISLSNNKLCRGIDVLIKNDDIKEISCDYFTRIFLPLGASQEFKEDPACGSGSAYISEYLIEYKKNIIIGKKLKFYQASNSGAFITTKISKNNIIEVMGKVK